MLEENNEEYISQKIFKNRFFNKSLKITMLTQEFEDINLTKTKHNHYLLSSDNHKFKVSFFHLDNLLDYFSDLSFYYHLYITNISAFSDSELSSIKECLDNEEIKHNINDTIEELN